MKKFFIVDIKGIMEALTINNKVIQFKTLSIFKDRVFCSLEMVKNTLSSNNSNRFLTFNSEDKSPLSSAKLT